ncbi:hypothetical protein BK139_19700 [Paenibacillus sp. FSL R5-0490]|uniref:hypothetical protein n=1 Tax=Bacillales TaxID=1385 RepID=UPI00096C9C89|nr:hypothetical protein [Paenibacillus sp. FSL R5-0490]OMF54061.1 hypothetical protein BK139_19700 [Paenibacillus sp. FSL R5-0490]
MKKLLYTLLAALFIAGCSNEETKDVKNVEKSTENIAQVPIKQASFESFSDKKTYEIIGEMEKFALFKKPFEVEKEDTYTWLVWIENQEKAEELIGKEVEIFGTNERTKEKELLTSSNIEKLTSDDPQFPGSELAVKFYAKLKLLRKGKWKIESYVDNELLGSTVIYVEGKDEL